MPYGYNGKILRVNLSENKIWTEEPPEVIYRRYLGGDALGCYYLLKELPKGVDPLSPDNMLVIAPSIITGAPTPGTSRFSVAAKSPRTDAFGGSQAGGWWGPELKKAGFDGVILQGKAPKPSYIWIHDGQAEIRDASKIWGMVSGDAQEAIREELGEKRIRVLQTGPAGEKLVKFANITNELRHFNVGLTVVAWRRPLSDRILSTKCGIQVERRVDIHCEGSRRKNVSLQGQGFYGH